MPLSPKDHIGRAIDNARTAIFRIVIVKRSIDAGLAFLQAFGRGDPDDPTNQELIQEDSLDHIQHVGFESYPVTADGETEGIVVDADGGEACIAERRVLPSSLAALVPREARTYGEDGQSLLHKTGGDIEAEPKAAKHFKVGNGATQAMVLNGDNCPYSGAMKIWMGQVEVFINGLAGGTVNPLSTVFGPTAIATVTGSSTKGKVE